MAKEKKERYICEIALRPTPHQALKLDKAFEANRQVRNAVVGEALKRLKEMRRTKRYSRACKMKDGKEKKEAFKELRTEFKFTEFCLKNWSTQFTKSWINHHIGANTVSATTGLAFSSVNQFAIGKKGRPKMSSYKQFNAIEGRTGSCAKWKKEKKGDLNLYFVKFKKLKIEADPNDSYTMFGAEQNVRYVRMIRRTEFKKTKYYAQLVIDGQSPTDHELGEGKVGIDVGPRFIDVVSSNMAMKFPLMTKDSKNLNRQLRVHQRKLDRQTRQHNPDSFNENGTYKKGTKIKRSKGMLETKLLIKELHRKKSAERKNYHRKLANHIMLMGNDFRVETNSYGQWQKDKRFSRSINGFAPSQFIEILKYGVTKSGGNFNEINTFKTSLSQTCFCGNIKKKELSERWHICECGVESDRHLFSAYLMTFVENNVLNADLARESWSGSCTILQAALSEKEVRELSRLVCKNSVKSTEDLNSKCDFFEPLERLMRAE